MSGDRCTIPTCMPCGSDAVTSFTDSTGAPKVGFCVCSTEGVYSCASTNEWPPQ
jgi:hypothetical protein